MNVAQALAIAAAAWVMSLGSPTEQLKRGVDATQAYAEAAFHSAEAECARVAQAALRAVSHQALGSSA